VHEQIIYYNELKYKKHNKLQFPVTILILRCFNCLNCYRM